MATHLAKLKRGKDALAPPDDVIAENGRNDEKGVLRPPLGWTPVSGFGDFSETAGREFGFNHGAKEQLFLQMWHVYKAQDMKA